MAASYSIKIIAELTGLGKDLSFVEKADSQTTPAAAIYNYRTLATADTAEALDLGGVSTVTLIIIKAVSDNIDIDCDFVSSFDADLEVKEGGLPAVIPNPAGDVYVKNHTESETPVYEYIVLGTP
jgi:hypothetical protein